MVVAQLADAFFFGKGGALMEREGSLPLSQELCIAPHPETNELGPYFKTRTLKSILTL